MLGRFWHGLRVYFGFVEGPEALQRDDFGWGGVMGGGGVAMATLVLLDVTSVPVVLGVVVGASAFGWLTVRVARKLLPKDQ